MELSCILNLVTNVDYAWPYPASHCSDGLCSATHGWLSSSQFCQRAHRRRTTVILPPFCFSFSSVFPSNYYTIRSTYIRRTSPKLQELSRYVYNSFFFSLGFFFLQRKKVSSVNEKWLPFDSCPLKSRLLWYFAWH